ncbi:DUF1616 domain-containing protein [Natronoarchaeum sp. GCM10025321]|uniref:DUF1616 domain-containing protein n=1 Tax=Natronoarchaeum sp. GCM10025321 TaxID=3252684 RepID=UPI00360F350D
MSEDFEGESLQQFQRLIGPGAVDAAAAIGYVAIVGALFYFVGLSGFLRTLLALPVLLLLPGYALVSVVFPARPDRSETPTPDERSGIGLLDTGSPGWYERLALSVAMSIVLLPLFALVLATTRWDFSTPAVLVSVGGFTIIMMLGALARRATIPADDRFRYPGIAGAESLSELIPEDSPIDGVLNVVLLVTIVLALGTVAYGLAAPQPDQSTTEVQLLTQTDDGELVQAGYPETIPADDSVEMTVAITNDDAEPSTYTVVIEAQQVEETGDGLGVIDEAEIAQLQLSADPGERATQEHSISPPMTGENIRLNYYLYEGDPPEDPGPETADDHLWITVESV